MTKVTVFSACPALASSCWANITSLAAEGRRSKPRRSVSGHECVFATARLWTNHQSGQSFCAACTKIIRFHVQCQLLQQQISHVRYSVGCCRLPRLLLKLSAQPESNRWNICCEPARHYGPKCSDSFANQRAAVAQRRGLRAGEDSESSSDSRERREIQSDCSRKNRVKNKRR